MMRSPLLVPGWEWALSDRLSIAAAMRMPQDDAAAARVLATKDLAVGLYGGFVRLAGADPHNVLDRSHENLAVADLAGPGGLDDGIDGAFDLVVRHHHLDLHLGQEIDHVLGAAVELGVALLAAEALHFRDGQAGDADLRERLAHLVEFERLHDGFDFLHFESPPAKADCILIRL